MQPAPATRLTRAVSRARAKSRPEAPVAPFQIYTSPLAGDQRDWHPVIRDHGVQHADRSHRADQQQLWSVVHYMSPATFSDGFKAQGNQTFRTFTGEETARGTIRAKIYVKKTTSKGPQAPKKDRNRWRSRDRQSPGEAPAAAAPSGSRR
jgi:hypothetical protein